MAAPPNTVRLVSWNVNGFRAVVKKGFWDWLEAEQPDIVGLQETKISSDQLTLDLAQREGYHLYWSHAEKRGYSGVAILSKQEPLSVREGLGIPQFDSEGRVLIAEYPDFVFYNIYYPNGQRGEERLRYKLAFYDAFLAHADAMRAQGKSLVIGGDYNTAHKEIDLARPKANETVSGFLPIERAWLDRLVAHGYVDTFRERCDAPHRYSWWNMRTRARERNVGWRIDYFFVSDDARARIVEAEIHDQIEGSDHCPISLTLALAGDSR
ncbi:MAG: exodeoxyribonuclease III [Vampirovibrionales bacterium]|nr:exodeoxyribonuclease III [Vampirovibrionales bacterium]